MARTAYDEVAEGWGRGREDLADVINGRERLVTRPDVGVPPLEAFSGLNDYVRKRLGSVGSNIAWEPQDTREVLTSILLGVADDDYDRRALVVAKTLLGLREPPDLDTKIPNPLSGTEPFLDVTLRQLQELKRVPKLSFQKSIDVRRSYVSPLYRVGSTWPSTYANHKPSSPIWQVADDVLRALLARIEEVARTRSEQGILSDKAIGLTYPNTASDEPSRSAETNSHETESAETQWYEVDFNDQQTQERVRTLARELIETVPRAIKEGRETLAGTPLLEAHTVQELLERFDLLTEISNSLDRFAPTVFEQDLDELKQTTDTRSRPESLRSLLWDRSTPTGAWAYVRPGVRIEDLDAALAKLQAQKAAWRDMAHPFTLPRIPVGVSQAKAQMQAARKALEQLDEMLDRTGEEGLTRLPFEEVTQGLYQLAAGGK